MQWDDVPCKPILGTIRSIGMTQTIRHTHIITQIIPTPLIAVPDHLSLFHTHPIIVLHLMNFGFPLLLALAEAMDSSTTSRPCLYKRACSFLASLRSAIAITVNLLHIEELSDGTHPQNHLAWQESASRQPRVDRRD